ncbi:MAG TPA: DUF6039 family protein [Streptosporangiaceae bacterium]|jgi:hypothetical protein
MTVTTSPATNSAGVRTAQDQTRVPAGKLLHSGNAGMIIYRVGQLSYEFAAEGRGFSVDLLNYVNENQVGVASTFCYEEVFGVRDRLHWFISMRVPNDYRQILEMVDHDTDYQDISLIDRLPEKGHGNWERIFIDASMQERVLVPQHGLDHGHDDGDGEPERRLASFVPPAHNQTAQPVSVQLNSANAGAIVIRRAQVKYEFRKEGRLFAFDWQEYVNQALPGRVTALLYEETWGRQDRIYWLIHLRELTDYQAVAELDRSQETQQRIFSKPRIHPTKGGGTWQKLFLPGSIRDVLLQPAAPSAAAAAG